MKAKTSGISFELSIKECTIQIIKTDINVKIHMKL